MSIILDRPSATDEDRELRADLVGRAAKLVPLLAANARRSEDDRQVVAENIAAIDEAGLLSIMRRAAGGAGPAGRRTHSGHWSVSRWSMPTAHPATRAWCSSR